MPRHGPVGVAYPDWLRAQILDSSPHETTRAIAKRLSVSQSTVVRVMRDAKVDVTRPGPRRNTCTLNEGDAAFLCLLKVTYPQVSLKSVSWLF